VQDACYQIFSICCLFATSLIANKNYFE
jgi:hypothetical protein